MPGPKTKFHPVPAMTAGRFRHGWWNVVIDPMVHAAYLLLQSLVSSIFVGVLYPLRGLTSTVQTCMVVSVLSFGLLFYVRRGGKMSGELIRSPANKKIKKGSFVVVTGANCGIGKVTALQLADWGCDVVIGCRDEKKGKDAVHDLNSKKKDGSVECIKLDLSDLVSVKEFAKKVLEKNREIVLLVNNAGVMAPLKLMKSKQGHELQFATNHLGHYLLTRLLFDNIAKADGRIVNLSSLAHVFGPHLDIDRIREATPDSYSPYLYYGYSKTCNLLFSVELNNKFKAAGSSAFAVSVHPGGVNTELSRHQMQSREGISATIFSMLQKSPWEGAQTSLYCCAESSERLVHSGYYADAQLTWVQASVTKAEYAQDLWNWSSELCQRYL